MADFCKQCSIEIFGEDYNDLAGLCEKGSIISELCEGCGPCYVDYTGTCVSCTCLKKHKLNLKHTEQARGL